MIIGITGSMASGKEIVSNFKDYFVQNECKKLKFADFSIWIEECEK